MIEDILNSDRFYRSAYEYANDAIFLMDRDTFIDCNRKTEEMFGCHRDDILRRKPQDFSPPQQPDGSSSGIRAKEYIEAAMSGAPQVFEWTHKKLDGTIFDAEVSLNRFSIGDNTLILAIVRDVTRRKQAETALKESHDALESMVDQRTVELRKANELLEKEIARREKAQDALGKSEARYREFLEQVNSIVLEMDVDGKVTFMNRFGRRFFGFTKAEIIGKSVMGTIVPELDGAGIDLRQHIQNILRNPEVYFNSENENIRKNGERVWISWTNRVVYNPKLDGTEILCIGVDRTEQKKAQDTVAREIKEKAAADERNRLARELHDAVSQTLFSASLIAEVLPRLWEKDREEGKRRLEEVRQLSRGALAEMRTLLFELRPSALAEAELSELLRHLADSITGRWRLPVTVDIMGAVNLAPDVKIAFYRIVQEALNNVAKHSGASGATVVLECRDDRTVLSISDDGKGFDVASLPPESMGIGIMKERARAIGAQFTITSRLKRGTEISITLPETHREVVR